MEFFFNPRGIALVGATANPQKGGHLILQNLIRGFQGRIYPINPNYSDIEGLPCFPSVAGVPDPVDLAIIFVPARHVPAVLRECAGRHIPGAIIESGGFAETGPEGRKLQEEIAAIARDTGMRLWGPNCMGLLDTSREHVFSFVAPTIWETGLVKGNVSLIVQSGMLSAGFLIDIMTHGTMGIGKACSIGNRVDVDECDLLEYLVADPGTGAVGLYLESIPDGRRFVEICRRSPKPVVVLKGGKSRKGAQAAMSHTASLAGNDALVRGALAQAGVVLAHDFKQMMDLCRTLASYPDLPAGTPRIAVLTFSGGAGIVSADFIEELGMETAVLSPAAKEALQAVFPAWMPVDNPVDLWPAVEQHGLAKVYEVAIRAVGTDPRVDAIFFHAFVGGMRAEPSLADLARDMRALKKPIFCWLIGKRDAAQEFQARAQGEGIPVFGELYRAAECLRAAFGRERPAEKAPPVQPNASIQQMLAPASGVLDEHHAKEILAAAGIEAVRETPARSEAEAQAALSTLGPPVVLKGLLPGALHKTDQGLVRLDVRTPAEAAEVFRELRWRLDGRGRVLVQKQVPPGLELIAGLVRDPQFGSCVMCGLGGTLAEVLKDTVFGVAPLSLEEALQLIGRLKSRQLLDGFRGAPPVDRHALARVLTALGDLGHSFPRIREIDINPLIIHEGRPVAVDASIIMED